MPAYPSRSRRPPAPRPITLTERDDAMLASVFLHRYLAARHVHALHFGSSSLRAAQRRLRSLWEHEHLDRAIIPTVVLGEGSDVPHTGGPLYCLAAAGARRVSSVTGRPFSEIPSTPAQNRVAFETLCHHLVVTDWMVSLVAAHKADGITLAELVRERFLRPHAAAHPGLLVPDGAVRFTTPGGDAWCYIEVVRADPRGGRKTLKAKLKRYTALHHARAFRTGYGHHPLRRVLFVTPTARRRDGLVVLAESLPHGAQLFAFASYESGAAMSAPSAFLPSTVHLPMWRTPGSATLFTLAQLLTLSPHEPPSPPTHPT